jgi:hypothetical protein
MRCVTRLLAIALFALLVALPWSPAAAAEPAAAGPVIVIGLDQPTTAPPGPDLNPPQESPQSRQKLVIGFFAALLLAIVIFGRTSVNKRRKKKRGAVSK